VSKDKDKRLKIFSRSLFVIYLAVALYLMLFSEEMGRTMASGHYRYNLILFKEIRRFITYGGILGVHAVFINLAGNVLCFIPFGFYLPILNKKLKSFILITILTFCFSLLIEVIQLIFKVGCFDVDDMFLNTIGGIIGYLTFLIYRKVNGGINGKK
jgi:glycopeptide antibiotics resistance protein